MSFPWCESSCVITATRSPPVPSVVAAVIAPQPPRTTIDINDLHVSYAYGHGFSLVETARQLGITLAKELFPCSGCSMAKWRRLPIPKITFSRSTRPLQRVFVDLSGPRPVQSIWGARYIMIVKDDYSQYSWIFSLRRKSESADAFKFFSPTFVTKASHLPSRVYRLAAGGNSLEGPLRNCAGTTVFARN